jgi:hypothetical protein
MPTPQSPPCSAPSRTRRTIFTAVCVLVALALGASAPNVLAPWMPINIEGVPDPTEMRWSFALEGAVDLLFVGCIVCSVLRPARSSLLVQYVGLGALVAAAVIVPFAGWPFLVVVASLLLVPLTYPYPQQLRSLRPQGNLAVPLIAVGVITTAVLVPLAIQALRTQLAHPSGQVAGDSVWATTAEHLLLLALGGVLVATRRPGWQVLVVGIAAVYAYLGIASITLPDQPGTWGTLGGTLALVASAAYLVAGALSRRSVRLPAAAAPAPIHPSA